MAHIDLPPHSRREILDGLRPGDILTHCFRPFPNAPVTADGQIRGEILEARERGILFNIWHGACGFAFESAEIMLSESIFPDTISSDVHAPSVDGPARDLLAVMSKLLVLGITLAEIIRAVTATPAQALRRGDVGTLRQGSAGDATILRLQEGTFTYVDAVGQRLKAKHRITSKGSVIAGRLWHWELGK